MRLHKRKFDEEFRSKHFKNHKDAILCCDISKDGRKLCLCSADKTASVWSIKDCYKKPMSDDFDEALLHSLQDLGAVKINCCSFTHDAKTLCLGLGC